MTKEHEPVWLTLILGCVTIYSRGYVNKLTGSEEDALEPGKEIYTSWGLCMNVVNEIMVGKEMLGYTYKGGTNYFYSYSHS